MTAKEVIARAMASASSASPDAQVVAGEPWRIHGRSFTPVSGLHQPGQLWEFFVGDAFWILARLDEAGFAIVPKEPTEAMIKADPGSRGNGQTASRVDFWRAMLAAAPGAGQ